MKDRICITIDDKILEQIKAIANVNNRSLSNFIELLCQEFLEQE